MSETEQAWRDYWERQPRTILERSPTIMALLRQAFEAGFERGRQSAPRKEAVTA